MGNVQLKLTHYNMIDSDRRPTAARQISYAYSREAPRLPARFIHGTIFAQG
jgi:hypothetical protein